MSNVLRVLVAGGGIAGLAVARALARGRPHVRVTVFEQAKAYARAGHGIALAPNGLRVIKSLGLLDAVHDSKTSIVATNRRVVKWETGEVVSDQPLPRGTLPRGQPLPKGQGSYFLWMERAQLHRALLDGVEKLPNVDLEWGRRVLRFTRNGASGVVARCVSTGGQAEYSVQGDLLIGADGIHSLLRRQIDGEPRSFGDQAELAFSGGLVAATKEDVDAGIIPGHVVSMSRRLPIFSELAIMWCSPSTIAWAATSPNLDKAAQSDGWGNEITEASLRRLCEGLPAHLQRMLMRSLEPPNPKPMTILTTKLDIAQRWSQDRAVLLGDAAHAMHSSLGQGANTTLEDALMLEKVLNDAGVLAPPQGPAVDRQAQFAAINTALAAFREARFERTNRVATASRLITASRFEEDEAKRTALIKEMGIYSGNFDWLFNYKVDESQSDEPNYQVEGSENDESNSKVDEPQKKDA